MSELSREPSHEKLFQQLQDGRTELVFDLLARGVPANFKDAHGVALIRHCAYYGDVSAIRFLLLNGERLESLGPNLDLGTAAFHGHWRLCLFLLELGANAKLPDPETGETPLHNAVSHTDRLTYDRVVQVLLTHGADPNAKTVSGAETGAFMRDCRTKGETPLHRAAAFGEVETIRLLKQAGAKLDIQDAHGDTPLSWASWYNRPTPVLRELLYSNFRIHPQNQPMKANLRGKPLL